MNILNLLLQNFRNGSRTKSPLELVPLADGFRGELEHQTSLCISCGTCSYVCSSTAILITTEDKFTEQWKYTEDLCTFCGRCVDACPTNALSFKKASPEPITDRSEHYQIHEVKLSACQRCGEPMHKLPDSIISKMYQDETSSGELHEVFDLCDRCRQVLAVKRLKSNIKELRNYGN